MNSPYSEKCFRQICTEIHNKFFENLAVNEIMWKNSAQRAGQRWQYSREHAHCIPDDTDPHSQYVIIFAFPDNGYTNSRQ